MQMKPRPQYYPESQALEVPTHFITGSAAFFLAFSKNAQGCGHMLESRPARCLRAERPLEAVGCRLPPAA